MRVLEDEQGAALVRVRQASKTALTLTVEGACGRRFVPVVQRMLGTEVELRSWYRHVKAIPWLDRLARDLRGVKPPRYPTLWEALCHAIVFQQISIHAAAAIMQRTIVAFGSPVEHLHGERLYPFPQPHRIAGASQDALRASGLSVNKVAALQHVARAVLDGTVEDAQIAGLSTPEAIAKLCELRGIGPWSAAVVLLRGLGRLDVFPLKDSGVAASLRLLSGNPEVEAGAVLLELGAQRGMLYFHLLLGRLAATARVL